MEGLIKAYTRRTGNLGKVYEPAKELETSSGTKYLLNVWGTGDEPSEHIQMKIYSTKSRIEDIYSKRSPLGAAFGLYDIFLNQKAQDELGPEASVVTYGLGNYSDENEPNAKFVIGISLPGSYIPETEKYLGNETVTEVLERLIDMAGGNFQPEVGPLMDVWGEILKDHGKGPIPRELIGKII
jgi:hypothetical protein